MLFINNSNQKPLEQKKLSKSASKRQIKVNHKEESGVRNNKQFAQILIFRPKAKRHKISFPLFSCDF